MGRLSHFRQLRRTPQQNWLRRQEVRRSSLVLVGVSESGVEGFLLQARALSCRCSWHRWATAVRLRQSRLRIVRTWAVNSPCGCRAGQRFETETGRATPWSGESAHSSGLPNPNSDLEQLGTETFNLANSAHRRRDCRLHQFRNELSQIEDLKLVARAGLVLQLDHRTQCPPNFGPLRQMMPRKASATVKRIRLCFAYPCGLFKSSVEKYFFRRGSRSLLGELRRTLSHLGRVE